MSSGLDIDSDVEDDESSPVPLQLLGDIAQTASASGIDPSSKEQRKLV